MGFARVGRFTLLKLAICVERATLVSEVGGSSRWAKAHFFIAFEVSYRMSRQATVARVEEICERVGESEKIEIVEVELKGSGRNHLLRIFIDTPTGVTHGDCERISQKVGELLDADEFLPGHYVLEVSSPGVERKLRKLADFVRFQGQKARIVMRETAGEERKSRFVEGVLAGSDGSEVLLETAAGETLRIPIAAIDRANLKFEW